MIDYRNSAGIRVIKSTLRVLGLNGVTAEWIVNLLRFSSRLQWAFANLVEARGNLDTRITSGPLRGFRLEHLLLEEANAVWRNRMEPVSSELLARLDLRGATVLDLGGCYGYHALLFSRAVGPSGMVHSFEPDVWNAARLLANLRLNAVRNVVVQPFAVADQTKTVSWQLDPLEPWNARIADDRPGERVHRLAAVITLDDAVLALGVVDGLRLLKIDVEGSEAAVLRGAEHVVLTRSRPIVFCELHSPHSATAVLTQLRERSYVWKLIEFMSPYRQHIFAWPSELTGVNRDLLEQAPVAREKGFTDSDMLRGHLVQKP